MNRTFVPLNAYDETFVESHHLTPMSSVNILTVEEFDSALFVGLHLGHTWAHVLRPFANLARSRLGVRAYPESLQEVWNIASQLYRWDSDSNYNFPLVGGFTLRKRIYWSSTPNGNIYVGVSRPGGRFPIEMVCDPRGSFEYLAVNQSFYSRHLRAASWIPAALRGGSPFETEQYPALLREVQGEIMWEVRARGFTVMPDE